MRILCQLGNNYSINVDDFKASSTLKSSPAHAIECWGTLQMNKYDNSMMMHDFDVWKMCHNLPTILPHFEVPIFGANSDNSDNTLGNTQYRISKCVKCEYNVLLKGGGLLV